MITSSLIAAGTSPQTQQSRFDKADASGDGQLDKNELTEAMRQHGMTESASAKLFNQLDKDGDGEVSTAEHKQFIEGIEQRAQTLFTGISENGLGSLFSTTGEQDDSQKRLGEAMQIMRDPDASEAQRQQAMQSLSELFPSISESV